MSPSQTQGQELRSRAEGWAHTPRPPLLTTARLRQACGSWGLGKVTASLLAQESVLTSCPSPTSPSSPKFSDEPREQEQETARFPQRHNTPEAHPARAPAWSHWSPAAKVGTASTHSTVRGGSDASDSPDITQLVRKGRRGTRVA